MSPRREHSRSVQLSIDAEASDQLTSALTASGKTVQSYIPSPALPFSNFRVCFQRDTTTVPLMNPPEVWVCFLQVDEGKPVVKIFSIGIGEGGDSEGPPIWTLEGRFGVSLPHRVSRVGLIVGLGRWSGRPCRDVEDNYRTETPSRDHARRNGFLVRKYPLDHLLCVLMIESRTGFLFAKDLAWVDEGDPVVTFQFFYASRENLDLLGIPISCTSMSL